MPKNNFYDHGFDPYDALIQLNERVNALEKVHNQLATDYMKSQRDLTLALNSLNSLQKHYLAMSHTVAAMATGSIK